MALKINIPPEVEPYEQDIRRFVDAMVYKLKVHAGKGRWETLCLDRTVNHLKAEITELEAAIAGGNLIEVLTEAADVANYALIAASIKLERGE